MNVLQQQKTVHDGVITICVGSSRKAKVWKKKTMSWSQLVERLSKTKRTAETQAKYFKLPKEKQDEIKDVGGFVAGDLIDGKRSAMTCGMRQVITLDADFADENLWDMIDMLFGEYAICMYSTHKHTPEKPRLRLVIPLDRAVTPDEYQAVARKVAEGFGMDIFDDTTYQPHRLMYWPSTSIDGEFFFRVQDGPWLSADEVLGSYSGDWRDQTEWPVSSRQGGLITKAMKKQADPLEKEGLIGLFCRTYTIQEAIDKFLPDVYEPCYGHDDRYTYRQGTSSGGAIVYEDKFLFSHHATDPCTMLLVNAFDLVRIHKFHELDEGKSGEDITKRPSWSRMMELVADDDDCKVTQTREKMAEIQGDFDDLGEAEDEVDYSWTKKLKVSKKTGKVLASRANIRVILQNDGRIKDTFGYDSFSQRIAILRPPYWRGPKDSSGYWTDGDDAELRYHFETYYDIDSKQKIEDEVMSCANARSFHRVREYLNSLEWDGEPRMDTLFIDFLGAEDTEYTRKITRKMCIAAVARVMRPGIKFDNMVVLVGRQGLGKSYLLKKLGRDWFNDSLDSVSGKEAYEQLRGSWIIEMSELAALKKSEIEPIKQFISKQADIYRVSYAKRVSEFPRQCIFIGTTNETSFLRDHTGNRRFWPIRCGISEPRLSLWAAETDEYISQVWAEAVAAFRANESVWIGKDMEKVAKEAQAAHTEENPYVGMIEEYLELEVPENWYNLDLRTRREYIRNAGDSDIGLLDEGEKTFRRNRICPLEVWCELLEGDPKRFGSFDRKEIRVALDELEGWEVYDGNKDRRLRFGPLFGLQRAYVRIGTDGENPEINSEKVEE